MPPPTNQDSPHNEASDLKLLIEQRMTDDKFPAVEESYIRWRFNERLKELHKEAKSSHRWFRVASLVALVGGLMVSTVATLQEATDGARWLTWVVVSIGLLVATAAALNDFYQWGQRSVASRQAGDALTREAWEYLHRSGRYAETENPPADGDWHRLYDEFKARIQKIERLEEQTDAQSPAT